VYVQDPSKGVQQSHHCTIVQEVKAPLSDLLLRDHSCFQWCPIKWVLASTLISLISKTIVQASPYIY